MQRNGMERGGANEIGDISDLYTPIAGRHLLMYINVEEIKENEDGSAQVFLELDDQMMKFLIQQGFEAVMMAKAKEVIDV